MTRRLLPVSLLVPVLLAGAGCSTRQAQADRSASDVLRSVAHRLDAIPVTQWARPSPRMRRFLEQARSRYRVLGTDEQGRVELAVWTVDLGADPFTDDTPRTGIACARLRPERMPVVETMPCPPRLASDPEYDAVDWSDASSAHEQASIDIDSALADTQRAIIEGGTRSIPEALQRLRNEGIVVRHHRRVGVDRVRVTLARTAQAPRISDTRDEVSATTCADATLSVAASDPSYVVSRRWDCDAPPSTMP